jgi:hypothetical protein
MKSPLKYLVIVLALSGVSFVLQAQSSTLALNILTKKLADVNDAILIYKSNARATISDQKISFQNGQVLINYTFNKETYYAQFQAENIMHASNFSEALCVSNSPIGVIRLYFDNHLVKSWNTSKNGENPIYRDYFDFYFLQKDPEAFKTIYKYISELQPSNSSSNRDTTLGHLYNKHLHSEFWVKDKNASTTNFLDDVMYNNNLLYLYYREVTESIKSTTKRMYMTVIPLSNMEKIILDMEFSKPAGIYLDSDVKGLEHYWYVANGDYYSFLKNKADQIPMFLKIATPGDKQHLQDYLNRAIRINGGKQTLKAKIQE